MAIFPDGPELAGTRMSTNFILDVLVGILVFSGKARSPIQKSQNAARQIESKYS